MKVKGSNGNVGVKATEMMIGKVYSVKGGQDYCMEGAYMMIDLAVGLDPKRLVNLESGSTQCVASVRKDPAFVLRENAVLLLDGEPK